MIKLQVAFTIETILIATIIALLIIFIFTSKKKKGEVKRRNIYSGITPIQITVIAIAAIGATYVIYKASTDITSSAMVMILIVSLAPYVIIGQNNRITKEAIFNDVIIYCQNMAMMLKQTHDVYNSLLKVRDDLNTILRDDIESLIKAFEQNKESVLEAMRQIEKNYPYSCINNLDIIMLHMSYEKSNIDDNLIIDFQEDLEVLERDVKDNAKVRSSKRVIYIGITIVAIVGYYFFVNQLKPTFAEAFETPLYKITNICFLLATLLTVFFVDNYYNKNTTKE